LYDKIRKEVNLMVRINEFSRSTQQAALERQKHRCASCGTLIAQLGNAGIARHRFGEGAQAHHIRHVKLGGTNSVSNCVIICLSCHYSAHEGGNFRFGMVGGGEQDYPHFYG
jgi:5-methylcytosine-specific restriction endonuclease McrA